MLSDEGWDNMYAFKEIKWKYYKEDFYQLASNWKQKKKPISAEINDCPATGFIWPGFSSLFFFFCMQTRVRKTIAQIIMDSGVSLENKEKVLHLHFQSLCSYLRVSSNWSVVKQKLIRSHS